MWDLHCVLRELELSAVFVHMSICGKDYSSCGVQEELKEEGGLNQEKGNSCISTIQKENKKNLRKGTAHRHYHPTGRFGEREICPMTSWYHSARGTCVPP
jgi:hypothetical protein